MKEGSQGFFGAEMEELKLDENLKSYRLHFHRISNQDSMLYEAVQLP